MVCLPTYETRGSHGSNDKELGIVVAATLIASCDGRSVAASSVGTKSENDIRSQRCDRPRSPLTSPTRSAETKSQSKLLNWPRGFWGRRPGARGLGMVGRTTPTLIQGKAL